VVSRYIGGVHINRLPPGTSELKKSNNLWNLSLELHTSI
jgi:hypothetical protein